MRDDIYCGLSTCTVCPTHQSNLSSDPRTLGPWGPTLLIPDTNVLYHQIDILEHEAISNVIVLQTTLEELRHRSLAIYNRVRALISEPDKKFYVFSNEHHRETFARKDRKETPNDRNDRAIRTAVKWYEGHAPKPLSVVLVTDDAENRRLAKSDGLKALSGTYS